MSAPRTFEATDIARENAAVWLTVARWLLGALALIATVLVLEAGSVGLHCHLVASASFWRHHLGAGGSGESLRRLLATLALVLIAMPLETLLFCRAAFAPNDASSAGATLLGALRGLFLDARFLGLLTRAVAASRPALSPSNDSEGGILRQLRSSLSVAPLAPPQYLPVPSDPWGPTDSQVIEWRSA